jgi:hypothetical protein
MKKILFILLCISIFLIPLISATDVVKIDVAGYISHGPMQPTIDAIKEVTSKYGDKVNVSWYDMGTDSGSKFMNDNHLSAHLNILIDGKYTYQLNNKTVTFQWFEGQGWTKADLDEVISNRLNGSAVPLENKPSNSSNGSLFITLSIVIIVVLLVVVLVWIFIKRKSKE